MEDVKYRSTDTYAIIARKENKYDPQTSIVRKRKIGQCCVNKSIGWDIRKVAEDFKICSCPDDQQ